MAYIYPYAGHNSNTVTTNNGNNQPITPTHHICGSKSSTQPNQITTTALKTAGKSHFISFFSFRKTGAVIGVLLVLLAAWAPFGNAQTPTQIQEIDWSNMTSGTTYTFSNNDCCNGNYFTITENRDDNDFDKWVKFTAPFGCKIKITYTKIDDTYGLSRGWRNNSWRYDHIYYNQGTTEPTNTSYAWDYNTAINGTANVWTTISSNSIAIKFQNTNNAGNSQFQIRVETTGCPDCICTPYSIPVCFEFNDYTGANNSTSDDSGLPACFERQGNYTSHVYNGTYSCGSNGIILGSQNNNNTVVILPNITGITNGTQISFKYRYSTDNGNLFLAYVDGNGDGHDLTTDRITRTTQCTNYTYTVTRNFEANDRLAFRYRKNNNISYAFIDSICIQNSNSCSTDPNFTNCPSSLMSGQTWTPTWNTSATPTGWTTDNASYSAGTVTAGSTIGNASVSATVDEDMPYCAGTLRCTFNVTCNNTNTLTVTSPIDVTIGDPAIDLNDYITANSSGGTPTFSTASGNITLNTTTGVVTGVTAGDATVRVTVPQKTTGGGITYCEKYVDITIHVIDPNQTQCEISYELFDSNEDGWDDNAAIRVRDLTTNTNLARLRVESGASATGSITVISGHNIRFTWVNGGDYDDECSYTIYAANEDVIFSGSDALQNPVDYTVDCSSPILSCDNNHTIVLNGNKTQTIECGETYCFYDSGGKLGVYSEDEEYKATFTSSGNISINFSQFVTEETGYNDWDNIKIYDGDEITGIPYIFGCTGWASGSTNAATGFSEILSIGTTYICTSGTMTVVWKSDYLNNYAGWKATITATDCCTDWDADFHYTTTSASIVAGSPYTNTTLVNNTAYNVSYTISPSMAGVSISSSGEVTTPANIEQTFTVTATIQRGGEYCDKKTTYTLDVGDGCTKIQNEESTYDDNTEGLGRTTYNNYVWAQMIYTSSEVNTSDGCTITSIAFKVDGSQSDLNGYPQTTTVYLWLTDKNQFDSRYDFVSPPNESSDIYFSDTWTPSDGWNVFSIEPPFAYTDHTKNLMVGILCKNTYYWEYTYMYHSETSPYRMILGCSDEDEPNPQNMGAFDPDDSYSALARTIYLPNIKICTTCCNLDATIQFGN